MIARKGTTFAQWIQFLMAQAPERQKTLLPSAAVLGGQGTFELQKAEAGRWRLVKGDVRVLDGQKFVYEGRAVRAEHDWLQFPVTGVSWQDALEYVKWLSDSRVVPRARMCREDEWERAARGADERLYAHGDVLGAQDGNFESTYGQHASAFGLDMVGSYPHVRSPFGLLDANGNAFELVRSTLEDDKIHARGGAYFFQAMTAATPNRAVWDPSWRNSSVGFRVCADLPRPMRWYFPVIGRRAAVGCRPGRRKWPRRDRHTTGSIGCRNTTDRP